MSIIIRSAKNSHECAAVGEISYQACSKSDWHHLVFSKVDPEEMKRHMTQLARLVRETYHGIVILAELEGKVVGYLLAWEITPDSTDPYRHKSMMGKPVGRHDILWDSLVSGIVSACDHVQEKFGPYLHVEEMGVLPAFQGRGVGRALMEYTAKAAHLYHLPIELAADPEAVPFYLRMHFKPVGKPISVTGNGKPQFVPMLQEGDYRKEEE